MKFDDYKQIIEKKLEEYLEIKYPEKIYESMKYSVLNGGKRLRPVMLLETLRMISGDYVLGLSSACAVEMLHCQSLIHDDLPCMDNDDYRRGKLTNHKVFGEATAVLAEDALLSFAPQIMMNYSNVDATVKTKILNEFFNAAGVYGIISGQIMDLDSEGKNIPYETLSYIHSKKTSALFECAIRIGAILGNANENLLKELTKFAQYFGMAFQISDDIIDETQTFEVLGKTPKKDEKASKATFVKFFGMEQSKIKLGYYCERCCDILESNKFKSKIFMELIESIKMRIK